MSTAMDMFLSATDSLPFPDILLDIDIKSEIDTLVGGHNDFSGFDFDDLPPAASSSFDMEADTSVVSTHHDIGWSDQSSSMDFGSSEDDGGGGAARGGGGRAAAPRMVNPNAVMPFMTSLAQSVRSPSPLKESHLTFSPATIKITSAKPEVTTIKKDLTTKLEEVVEKRPVLKAVTRVTPILAKPVVKTMVKPPTIVTFRNTMTTTNTNNSRQVSSPMRINHVNTVSSVRAVSSVPTSRKATNPRDHQVYLDVGERVYPKPGFSYSCLIAMALKNSRSGSLPVSEIYNFMCFHFPYFKTAPNGWKNSVRHNLSLNKCFEKIEKPALNGAQRKGCLWAMNPAKISKMDDEMQKITTKDPHSIKRAMTNPENLEMLERGEMKFASSYDESDNFGDSCGSAEEQSEPSDSEHEQEIEVETTNQYQFFRVEQAEDDTCDPDVEVSEEIGYEEMEDDQELLRVEMALAQKELLQYERTHNNKRRRTFFVQR